MWIFALGVGLCCSTASCRAARLAAGLSPRGSGDPRIAWLQSNEARGARFAARPPANGAYPPACNNNSRYDLVRSARVPALPLPSVKQPGLRPDSPPAGISSSTKRRASRAHPGIPPDESHLAPAGRNAGPWTRPRQTDSQGSEGAARNPGRLVRRWRAALRFPCAFRQGVAFRPLVGDAGGRADVTDTQRSSVRAKSRSGALK